MKPSKVIFYIYSESDDEILELQKALYDFVNNQYNKGALVTASKLTSTLRSFGDSPIITKYLNGK